MSSCLVEASIVIGQRFTTMDLHHPYAFRPTCGPVVVTIAFSRVPCGSTSFNAVVPIRDEEGDHPLSDMEYQHTIREGGTSGFRVLVVENRPLECLDPAVVRLNLVGELLQVASKLRLAGPKGRTASR